MTMYTELLAAAWEANADDPSQGNVAPGDLLGRLLELRALIEGTGDPVNADGDGHAAKGMDRVANELSYDVTLMALAASVGIGADPDRFVDPEAERCHLERALEEAGVAVAEKAGRCTDCPDAR